MEYNNNINTEQKNVNQINPLKLKKEKLESRNLELKEENKRLNIRLEDLKKNVLELKQHVDNVIYKQIDLKSKKITDLRLQIEVAKNKIYELNKQLDDFDSISNSQKAVRQKLFSLINDKLKNENFYLTQEDIIKDLRENNKKLREKRIKINEEFKKADLDYTNLYNNIELNKKTIYERQTELQKQIEKNKESINILNEKSIEIANLKNILNLLKAENEQSFINNQNNKNLKKNDSNSSLNQNKNNQNSNSSFNNNNNNDISSSFTLKQKQLNQPKVFEGLNSNSITNIIDQSNLNENEENNINEVAALAHNYLEE